MPESEKNYLETGGLASDRLNDLRSIFKEYEVNLRERKGMGEIAFEQILQDAKGLRDEYNKLFESLEIDDKERGKFLVELEAMDLILEQAGKTGEAEAEI